MANTREHRYSVSVTWNGNLGSGTSGYRDYSRDYEIGADGKPVKCPRAQTQRYNAASSRRNRRISVAVSRISITTPPSKAQHSGLKS